MILRHGALSFLGSNRDRSTAALGLPIDGFHPTRHISPMNPPNTPGEILLEDYLEPMGISQNAMARAIGVHPRAINEIVHGKHSITPQMSIRFGQSEDFWHGIQVECDFRALRNRLRELFHHIQPALALKS
jgi:addiction module HigA family antidote